MQADRIRGDAGCGSGMVCVSRDGEGDSRKLMVPLAELRRPHFAPSAGGRGVSLPPGSLAAYMFCDLIPAGVPFGHGHVHCVRRGRPSSIKVVIDRVSTSDAVYGRLREMAEQCNAVEES